jgi:hypothetical protein
MPNVILLLGAGFSKNWNGLLATEVTEDLTSRLQSDSSLCDLLNSIIYPETHYFIARQELIDLRKFTVPTTATPLKLFATNAKKTDASVRVRTVRAAASNTNYEVLLALQSCP